MAPWRHSRVFFVGSCDFVAHPPLFRVCGCFWPFEARRIGVNQAPCLRLRLPCLI